MQVIPLQPVPAQIVKATLGEQIVQVKVRQTRYGVFMDLYADDALIIGGVVCENRNRIVRDAYLGFDGDLAFFDTQGESDPNYDGLGDRFLLAYLTAAEVAAMGLS